MRLLTIVLLSINFFSCACKDNEYTRISELVSPDGKLKATLLQDKNTSKIFYTLTWKDSLLVRPSEIALDIEGSGSGKLNVRDIREFRKDTSFRPVLASKRKVISDTYAGVLVSFDQPLSLELRMYENSVAFRWIGRFSKEVVVNNETFEINTRRNDTVFFSPYKPLDGSQDDNGLVTIWKTLRGYTWHETYFETQYNKRTLADITPNTMMYCPVLLEAGAGVYLSVAESDVADYPGLVLTNFARDGLRARFAPFPLQEELPSDPSVYTRLTHVTKEADFIARTSGERAFPWRIMLVSDRASDIAASDIVAKLATPPNVGEDYSWIRPGQITDEWLVNVNLFGVSFKAGKNTASYKYYIDFASKFGIENIMLDEGWYINGDIANLNRDINLDSVCAYARSKNVGVGLWFNAAVLDSHLEENLERFSKMGVKIVLADFFNRNDQKAMNFYVKLAKACAKYKMMLNLHSAPAPAGFEITYPNAINREGVLGSEWNGWSKLVTPDHNLTIPFTRMVSGSLDYEPGLLDNSNLEEYRNVPGKPMSLGTRCHQLGMYIVYDAPLQYFVGNPSQGIREPDYMHFLGAIPTTWDETLVLAGEPGEYIVTARLQQGPDSVWYIGAMNNWTARDLKIDITKLGLDNYKVSGIVDGKNSDSYPSDYEIINKDSVKSQLLEIHLGKGGGGVWRLEKASGR